MPEQATETSRRRSIGGRRNPATEAAVLAAARELLAERGFAGFSIDEVARRARAGKPTIYRWWPTRADLLADVYLGERAARVERAETGRLADDLAHLARGFFSAWRGSPAGQALRGLAAEAQASDAGLKVLWDRVMPAWLHPVREVLGDASRRREVDPADIDLTVELFSGFLLRRLLTGQIDDDRSSIDRMSRLLASGRGRREVR